MKEKLVLKDAKCKVCGVKQSLHPEFYEIDLKGGKVELAQAICNECGSEVERPAIKEYNERQVLEALNPELKTVEKIEKDPKPEQLEFKFSVFEQEEAMGKGFRFEDYMQSYNSSGFKLSESAFDQQERSAGNNSFLPLKVKIALAREKYPNSVWRFSDIKEVSNKSKPFYYITCYFWKNHIGNLEIGTHDAEAMATIDTSVEVEALQWLSSRALSSTLSTLGFDIPPIPNKPVEPQEETSIDKAKRQAKEVKEVKTIITTSEENEVINLLDDDEDLKPVEKLLPKKTEEKQKTKTKKLENVIDDNDEGELKSEMVDIVPDAGKEVVEEFVSVIESLTDDEIRNLTDEQIDNLSESDFILYEERVGLLIDSDDKNDYPKEEEEELKKELSADEVLLFEKTLVVTLDAALDLVPSFNNPEELTFAELLKKDKKLAKEILKFIAESPTFEKSKILKANYKDALNNIKLRKAAKIIIKSKKLG